MTKLTNYLFSMKVNDYTTLDLLNQKDYLTEVYKQNLEKVSETINNNLENYPNELKEKFIKIEDSYQTNLFVISKIRQDFIEDKIKEKLNKVNTNSLKASIVRARKEANLLVSTDVSFSIEVPFPLNEINKNLEKDEIGLDKIKFEYLNRDEYYEYSKTLLFQYKTLLQAFAVRVYQELHRNTFDEEHNLYKEILDNLKDAEDASYNIAYTVVQTRDSLKNRNELTITEMKELNEILKEQKEQLKSIHETIFKL